MSDCQFQTSICYFQFSSYLTSLHHLTTVAESVCWLILSSQIYSNTLTFYIRIPHWILALFISGMMVITRVHSWTSFIPCGWFDHFSGLELSLKVEQISLFKTKLSCYSLENLLNITVQFSHSVVSNYLWPMDCSTPGYPVHHQLLEFAQTHVHQVSDAIQPSHSLSSPSLPAFNLSQQQGVFKLISSSHQVAKVLKLQLQHQSFQWI